MTPEQGKAVAKRIGACYMECSSKESTGVQEIFDSAVDIAIGEKNSPEGHGGTASYGLGNVRPTKKNRCRIL